MLSPLDLCSPVSTIVSMTEDDGITYRVRATDPLSNRETVYECEGLAMAHAKVAELRMSGHRDVVISKVTVEGGA